MRVSIPRPPVSSSPSSSLARVRLLLSSSPLLTSSSLFLIFLLFSLSFLTDLISKHILSSRPLTFSLTFFQFFYSSFWSFIFVLYRSKFWLNLSSFPSPFSLTSIRSCIPLLSRNTVGLLLFVTGANSLGFLLTNWSLFSLPVAFVHTVKASESLFTALISRLLGYEFSYLLYFSLFPIVSGVALSSFYDSDFHLIGFLIAAESNACFAVRSVTSEYLLNQTLEGPAAYRTYSDAQPKIKSSSSNPSLTSLSLSTPRSFYPFIPSLTLSQLLSDEVTLYFVLSSLSTLLVFPLWYFMEFSSLPESFTSYPFGSDIQEQANTGEISPELSVSASSSSIFPPVLDSNLFLFFFFNGTFHYIYNQCSYFLLTRVNAISLVVIHACRRVLIIYFSRLVSGKSLDWQNFIGTALLVGGVIAFAWEKQRLNAGKTKTNKQPNKKFT
jgi:drug/metabolite transporter (DMT)-like permease